MSTGKPVIAFKVSVQLGDGNIMEHQIGADTVFGAVKFIQDEAVKNGWFIAGLLVEPFTEGDVVDAVEVAKGKLQ